MMADQKQSMTDLIRESQTLTELILSQKDAQIAKLTKERNDAWAEIDQLQADIAKVRAELAMAVIL